MLTVGESFNSRKDFLWSFIHTCQGLIGALQKVTGENKLMARELIKQERAIIKDTYAELKELQRWFATTKLEPDEPFYYPRKEGADDGKTKKATV